MKNSKSKIHEWNKMMWFCHFVFRSLKRSLCWCSQHSTATTSAALPMARQEVERHTPWREASLMSAEVSSPELCSKSSKQQRNWEHRAGRLVYHSSYASDCTVHVFHCGGDIIINGTFLFYLSSPSQRALLKSTMRPCETSSTPAKPARDPSMRSESLPIMRWQSPTSPMKRSPTRIRYSQRHLCCFSYTIISLLTSIQKNPCMKLQ